MKERIPNNIGFNEEFERKISRYRELRKMVDVLRKDVMYKSFICELIDDCKTGKPDVEIVFDSSTYEEVLDDEECNHSYMDKRQFDILLVDKNRDAIAICYHPAISPEYPASVDLKRFGLHHCIQLLFMPDDTYKTRPNDGNGRYYYQYRDFLLLLKKTKWLSAKMEGPKTTLEEPKTVVEEPKAMVEEPKVDPIDRILKKLDDVDKEIFKRFYDWMKKQQLYFEYSEETKRLRIKIARVEMGFIFEILLSSFHRIDLQDYNPLFTSKKGTPLGEKGKTEAKTYHHYVEKRQVESMRKKERKQYLEFYTKMKEVCEEFGLKYPE